MLLVLRGKKEVIPEKSEHGPLNDGSTEMGATKEVSQA